MERLTTNKNECNREMICRFEDCDICEEYCPHMNEDNCSCLQAVLEKLGEYEDAEEQGLLLRLPCKVGDTVYHESQYATVHKGVQAYQITNIMISQNKKGKWTKKYRAMMLLNGRIVDLQLNFSFDDLGKTVFLTKEAAEQALAEMKGGSNEV